jgi:hypothetical protein
MARRKRAARIHPRDGVYFDGDQYGVSWRSEYSEGARVGEAARKSGDATLLPKVVAIPAVTEIADRSYFVHNVSAQVVIADPDGWQYMPEDAPAGKRKAKAVRIAPKMLYARSRYVGQAVSQHQQIRHQKQYLGRGRAFHQGIQRALEGVDPELTGSQQSALMTATMDECERRGIDWRKFIKSGKDWNWLAKMLND